jgi:long-chain acyl-CoA synthetase
VKEIPKTTTLKVRRGQLREQIRSLQHNKKTTSDQKLTPTTTNGDLLQDKITQIIQEMSDDMGNQVTVNPLSTLQFELAFDSLLLMDLSSRMEKNCGVKLHEKTIFLCHTVEHVVHAVQEAQQKISPVTANETKTFPIPPIRGWLSGICFSFLKIIGHMLWSFQSRGLENIPDEGPFILCPNHASHLDVFWVAMGLKAKFRTRFCCFAKKEHFDHFLTRIASHLVGAVPVDRYADASPAMAMASEILAQSRPILIHPEGTRTNTGELLEFHRGPARLALKNNVPLIPVYIQGSYEIYPKHRWIPRWINWKKWRRYGLTITFGKPIIPLANSKNEIDLTDELYQAVASLGSEGTNP